MSETTQVLHDQEMQEFRAYLDAESRYSANDVRRILRDQNRRNEKMANRLLTPPPPTAGAAAGDRPCRTVENLIQFAGNLGSQSDAIMHRTYAIRDRLSGAKPREEVPGLAKKEPIEEVRPELDDLRWKLERIGGNLAQTEETLTDLEQI